jgi:hypothetical protein
MFLDDRREMRFDTSFDTSIVVKAKVQRSFYK